MVPLPSFAIRALAAHQERQNEERRFADDTWREHGLVFTTSIGTPIEPRNLLRHFQAMLQALKIDHRSFRNLRHTAASLLLAQGATLHEVKEILEHSQIRLTSDLYGHAYMTVKREAVARMDALLDTEQKPVAPLVAAGRPN